MDINAANSARDAVVQPPPRHAAGGANARLLEKPFAKARLRGGIGAYVLGKPYTCAQSHACAKPSEDGVSSPG